MEYTVTAVAVATRPARRVKICEVRATVAARSSVFSNIYIPSGRVGVTITIHRHGSLRPPRTSNNRCIIRVSSSLVERSAFRRGTRRVTMIQNFNHCIPRSSCSAGTCCCCPVVSVTCSTTTTAACRREIFTAALPRRHAHRPRSRPVVLCARRGASQRAQQWVPVPV